MKKITRYFVVLCMMLLLASGTVFAGQQGNVYDDGELLSETELSTLSESIDTFAEKSGWNVYALTTEDAGGKPRRHMRMISTMKWCRGQMVLHC